jgi:hypothetical protein
MTVSSSIGQTKNWRLGLKKISENKSDNTFSFSGGLLLPRDPDPQKNVRQKVLKAVIEIQRHL